MLGRKEFNWVDKIGNFHEASVFLQLVFHSIILLRNLTLKSSFQLWLLLGLSTSRSQFCLFVCLFINLCYGRTTGSYIWNYITGTISVNFHPLPVFQLLLPSATLLLSTCSTFCTITLTYPIPVPGQLYDPAPAIPSFLASFKFGVFWLIVF